MEIVTIAGRRRRYDFTVVVLPDTQYYSERFPETFHAQTRWICENTAKEHIAFVTHVGDLVQNGAQVNEWDVARSAMVRLIGTVPFAVVAGNHDYDRRNDPRGGLDGYRRRFGPDLFSRVTTTRGYGPDDCSSFHVFHGGGRDFLSLHLEPDPRDSALAWAQTVLDQNPTLPVLLTTHVYLNDATDSRDLRPHNRLGGNSPEQVFQKLVRRNPRIFLVQSGHWWLAGGETAQLSTNRYGGRVIELLSDYQGRPGGGSGWLRLLRFDLRSGQLHVQTYSPTLKQFETDLDSEFSLPLELDRPISTKPVSNVPRPPIRPD